MKRSKFYSLVFLVIVVVFLGTIFVLKFISVPNPIMSPKFDYSDDTREIDMTMEFGDEYTEDSRFFRGVSFDMPQDVLVTSYGRILVADAYADCLYEFDSDGSFIKTIGETDIGFNYPSALCEHDGNIIVADSFNNRLVILNGKTYEMMDEIALESTNMSYAETWENFISLHYTSIVSDGKSSVYISGDYYSNHAFVTQVFVSPNNRMYKHTQRIAQLNGTLYYDNDANLLYMAETKQLKSSQGSYKRIYGTHYLKVYDPREGTLETVFEFPAKYAPSAIFKTDEGFLTVSMTRNTVDRFDDSGDYIDTLYLAIDCSELEYAEMTPDGVLYLTSPLSYEILRLSMD